MIACLVLRFGSLSCKQNLKLDMPLTIPLERSSLQNHLMLQLTVYYILAVQFRTHSVGEKVIFLTKLKYRSRPTIVTCCITLCKSRVGRTCRAPEINVIMRCLETSVPLYACFVCVNLMSQFRLHT